MHQLRKSGKRLATGTDAHQHPELEPWTQTRKARRNREPHCREVAHHCPTGVDTTPPTLLRHAAVPCDSLQQLRGPFTEHTFEPDIKVKAVRIPNGLLRPSSLKPGVGALPYGSSHFGSRCQSNGCVSSCSEWCRACLELGFDGVELVLSQLH